MIIVLCCRIIIKPGLAELGIALRLGRRDEGSSPSFQKFMKSQRQILEDIIETELLELADNYESATDIVTNYFKFSGKGQYLKIILNKMKLHNIEFLNPYTSRKYKDIIKICPVCKKEFNTKDGGSSEKTTCSISCANTYFRSGKNHGSYLGNNYRTKCFTEHKKECVICGENLAIDVHHLDEDSTNDDINNLIPLCPTHHRYWHSKHKNLVEQKVLNYVKEFRNGS